MLFLIAVDSIIDSMIKEMKKSLYFIFIGWIIVYIDLEFIVFVFDTKLRIDILNDFIGGLMMFFGVLWMGIFQSNVPKTKFAFQFLLAVVLLQVLIGIDQFIVRDDPYVNNVLFLNYFYVLLFIIGMLFFCSNMVKISQYLGMSINAIRWRIGAVLIMVTHLAFAMLFFLRELLNKETLLEGGFYFVTFIDVLPILYILFVIYDMKESQIVKNNKVENEPT